MSRMTEAREAALATVAEGNVKRVSFPMKGKPHYTVTPYWQKPRQSPYEWLHANGYITHGPPSLRGTQVTITAKGRAYDGTNA